jgi:transcriptional regulator with XRE-family HTH domain
MKPKITIPAKAPERRKVNPDVITDGMHKQDVAPFQESFEVLAQEMARALPAWSDKLEHDSPAERAGLFLRTMRNAAGLSQTRLGEIARIKQADISNLENGEGKQGPTFDVLARIADACGFYITFAAKTETEARHGEEMAEHHGRPAGGHRLVRTYVMGDNGELSEFEGTSPPLKNDGTIVFDDSAGRTYKVSIEGPRAKVAIEEAEEDLVAAVQQAQSEAG